MVVGILQRLHLQESEINYELVQKYLHSEIKLTNSDFDLLYPKSNPLEVFLWEPCDIKAQLLSEWLCDSFAGLGIDVAIARPGSGAEGVQLLRDQYFELILCDGKISKSDIDSLHHIFCLSKNYTHSKWVWTDDPHKSLLELLKSPFILTAPFTEDEFLKTILHPL